MTRSCELRAAPLSVRKPADLCQESTPQKNSADGSSLFVTAMFPFEVSSDGAPARLRLLGLDHNACRCCRRRVFAVCMLPRCCVSRSRPTALAGCH